MKSNSISVNGRKPIRKINGQLPMQKGRNTGYCVKLTGNSAIQVILSNRWPEILRHAATKNHVDRLDYRMYFYPMEVASVDARNRAHWYIKVKMVDFDKNLDTYVQLKYSKIIEEAIRDVVGTSCTISIYSEGCKGSRCLDFFKSVGRKVTEFTGFGKSAQQKPIADAMALFGIKSLSCIDKEELKHQRNRLLKVYHPDENGYNSRYAEIINNSYSVLLEYAV